jgi:hypothetical protein
MAPSIGLDHHHRSSFLLAHPLLLLHQPSLVLVHTAMPVVVADLIVASELVVILIKSN